MKTILIALAVLVLIGGGIYFYQSSDYASEMPGQNQEMTTDQDQDNNTNTESEAKLKVANFSGELEKVDTGCFADGECFVVIDGKHVTLISGGSQEVAGQIQGVESIGELEDHIGDEMEVYAQDMGDGTYSLSGSYNFYVKFSE